MFRHALVAVATSAALAAPAFAEISPVERGGEALAGLIAGSPVALRHERDHAERHELSARERGDLAVFRETQTGEFDAIIADAAERWAVGPFLLKGLLYNESGLDPDLVGKRIYVKVGGETRAVGGGARGIAQFTRDGIAAVNEVREKRQRTGERVHAFTRDDVMNPEVAIPAAAELLSSYIRRFGRDGGVTAYNTGPYGGRLVEKHGFHAAQHRLRKVGGTHVQGYRFLLNVLRRTNQFRRDSGLRPLPKPALTRRSERPNT